MKRYRYQILLVDISGNVDHDAQMTALNKDYGWAGWTIASTHIVDNVIFEEGQRPGKILYMVMQQELPS